MRLELTESSAFFLSVLHSGDSGVSLFGEEAAVAFLLSAITAPSAGRRCVMSCVAEHLANTCEIQEEGVIFVRQNTSKSENCHNQLNQNH